MPVAEFPGDRSWGYNPCHIFSVEGSYGGSKALRCSCISAIPWELGSFSTLFTIIWAQGT